jgi:hypothetical protein
MILSMPLNWVIGKKISAFTHKTMLLRDERVKFTMEILQAHIRSRADPFS